MKKIKRIICVVLIILIAIEIGYLCYTGSRLSAIEDIGGVYEKANL